MCLSPEDLGCCWGKEATSWKERGLSPSRRHAAGLELRGPRVAAPSWGDRDFKADSSQGQPSPPHLLPQQGAGLCVLHREGKTALRVATSSANRRHIMGMLPGPWAADVLAGVRGWAELAGEGSGLQPVSC